MTDLEIAFKKLKAKQNNYTLLWQYYDGEQPLVYSTRRLREVFQDINARFSQNWCAVVIDSAFDRISLDEFSITGNDAYAERLNELFDVTDLDLDADDVHKAAGVCGESYVVAWKSEDGEIEAYYNDPRMVHVEYKKDSPKQKQFAAKWWLDDDGKCHITLYYEDHLEYYTTRQAYKNVSAVTASTAFIADDPDRADNPYKVIPVFHFRTEGRKAKSDLANVIEPQDAVNKLTADMMVTSEFNAFKQRWAVTNADTKSMKASPKSIIKLPPNDGVGEGTQVGEFSASEPGTYLEPIERMATFIAVVSRTPKHYLFAQGGDPSGEALIAMEAPLNKRVKHHIKRFEPVWQQIGAFLLLLDGKTVDRRDIKPVFAIPETVQPKTEAEIREINNRATVPLKTSLRWEGKSQSEIDKVEEEKKEAQAAAPAPPQATGAQLPGADMRAQAATLRAQARQAIAERENGGAMPPIGQPARAMSKV